MARIQGIAPNFVAFLRDAGLSSRLPVPEVAESALKAATGTTPAGTGRALLKRVAEVRSKVGLTLTDDGEKALASLEGYVKFLPGRLKDIGVHNSGVQSWLNGTYSQRGRIGGNIARLDAELAARSTLRGAAALPRADGTFTAAHDAALSASLLDAAEGAWQVARTRAANMAELARGGRPTGAPEELRGDLMVVDHLVGNLEGAGTAAVTGATEALRAASGKLYQYYSDPVYLAAMDDALVGADRAIAGLRADGAISGLAASSARSTETATRPALAAATTETKALRATPYKSPARELARLQQHAAGMPAIADAMLLRRNAGSAMDQTYELGHELRDRVAMLRSSPLLDQLPDDALQAIDDITNAATEAHAANGTAPVRLASAVERLARVTPGELGTGLRGEAVVTAATERLQPLLDGMWEQPMESVADAQRIVGSAREVLDSVATVGRELPDGTRGLLSRRYGDLLDQLHEQVRRFIAPARMMLDEHAPRFDARWSFHDARVGPLESAIVQESAHAPRDSQLAKVLHPLVDASAALGAVGQRERGVEGSFYSLANEVDTLTEQLRLRQPRAAAAPRIAPLATEPGLGEAAARLRSAIGGAYREGDRLGVQRNLPELIAATTDAARALASHEHDLPADVATTTWERLRGIADDLRTAAEGVSADLQLAEDATPRHAELGRLASDLDMLAMVHEQVVPTAVV